MVRQTASTHRHVNYKKEKAMLVWDEKRMSRGRQGARFSPARKTGLVLLGLFLLLLIVVLCAALSQQMKWR